MFAGVSVVIFLALTAAMSSFLSTTEADATAIAAYRVASAISASSCEIVGPGDITGTCEIDLPGEICGMPYLAYPSPDGHEVCVSVSGRLYHAPVVFRANDVKIAGFIASSPPVHTIAYDAFSRTVTIA
ncbi:MAG: hypothetical protein A4E28_01454 [Methanocella sp. PtaU1.Bin125]|nr:MAG: hypothetical protein A4E28_01454 [Methanocella sp. PtaU1.Bin125]